MQPLHFLSYPCSSSIRQVTLLPLWHMSPTVSDIAEWQSQNSSLGPPGSKPCALYPQSWLGRKTLGKIPEFSLLWTLSTLIRLIFTFLLPSGRGLFKNDAIGLQQCTVRRTENSGVRNSNPASSQQHIWFIRVPPPRSPPAPQGQPSLLVCLYSLRTDVLCPSPGLSQILPVWPAFLESLLWAHLCAGLWPQPHILVFWSK